jgi:hypothetical protein
MPRYAPNKSPAEIKRRYFTLIRQGYAGAKAARRLGVSMSCGGPPNSALSRACGTYPSVRCLSLAQMPA